MDGARPSPICASSPNPNKACGDTERLLRQAHEFQMGITIHYAGRLRKASDLEEFLAQAEELAEKRQWHFERLHDSPEHRATGFVSYPHQDCEPLRLEFDHRGRLSGWVKTQFAGPATHIEVVEFLRQLQPLLGKFGVRDEGEYWGTRNEETLRWHIDKINELIQEAVDKNPNIRTRVRMPDGLMIDYIE
jgi:hypothetical protein